MKKPQMQLNLALPISLNILRVHRYINTRLGCARDRNLKSGDRRNCMAFQANAKRMDQDRLFRFNAFRNPRRSQRQPL